MSSMHSDQVFILGAGVYQVPLILCAKKRGYQTLVASIPGDYPGIELADRFFPINTTDADSLLSVARENDVAAVVTAGTDVALYSIGMICDALGLSGPSARMAEIACNKYKMKEVLTAGGTRTAPYYRVASLEAAKDAMRAIDAPVMFKCVDKSGSRGIVRVDSASDARKAFEESFGISNCDYIVVEQFIEGHEIGVDGFVDRFGKIVFSVPHDKLVWNNGSANVPIGHRINDCLIHEYEEESDLQEQVSKAVSAMGLRNCFFNMDVLLNNKDAWIIEVGVRTGATCIPEIISAFYGFDYYDSVLDAALGKAPAFSTKSVVGAVESCLLFTETPKTFVHPAPFYKDEVQVSIDYKLGESTRAFRTGNDRCGQIIAIGQTQDTVSSLVAEAQKRVLDTCFR